MSHHTAVRKPSVVERAVYRCEGDDIEDLEFDPFQSPYEQDERDTEEEAPPLPPSEEDPSGFVLGKTPLKDAVRDLEIRAVREALERSRFKQAGAARLLQLSYHQFRGLYRKYEAELQER